MTRCNVFQSRNRPGNPVPVQRRDLASPALSRAAQTGLLARRSPLMKLKGDEQLVALVRAGNSGAFDAIVDRYQARLLGFCRQMLNSTEDAEDVLQEVLVNAHKAILADNREDSPTFRRWQAFTLSDANRHQLLIPPGIGNSVLALTDLVYWYKQDTHFVPGRQFTIRWDDPAWGFVWPIEAQW